PTDPLAPGGGSAREEDRPARVLGLREDGYRAALSERLDHLHAGHDRVPREVTRAILVGDELPRQDALAWNELEHLVHQKKRRAVRDDRLDRGLVELDHSSSVEPTLVVMPRAAPAATRGRGGRSTWRCRPEARSRRRSRRTRRRRRP